MKQILLLFFVLVGFGLSAQVSYAPEAPEALGKADETDIKVDIDIINDLDADQATFWSIDRVTTVENGHLVPEEWEFQLCDINTCYVWGLEQCPSGNPAVFSANQAYTYNLHMNPHGTSGIGDILFNIMDENGSILTSIPVHYDVDLVSGVSEADLDVKQVKLYPNPTSDYVQITNDNNVSKVAFYNIVGKSLNTSSHYPGKSHDVSTLQKGIYLLRLFDENDNVISVVRLNKN